MYYGRKKGIIIAIIVVIVVILLALGGIFVIYNTDLFKSEETLFWKYMASSIENTKMTQNIQLQDIEKMKEQTPYKVTGELVASSDNEELSDTLEKMKATVEQQTDKTQNYSQIKAQIQYSGANIFNIDYVHDNELYALKSDEIVTVYLGVRNENIKVLLQKLGIDDTLDIPNEINSVNYLDLFNFSEEELQHITQTYQQIIKENITSDNYSKQTEAIISKDGVSYNTTSYRVDLTGTQIAQIETAILNALKIDSITLNLIATKAKTLGLGEEYTTIEGITNTIDETIANIQNQTYSDCSIVVYAYKGETIATEVLIRNQRKITMYNNDNQTISFIIENLAADANYGIMNIQISNQVTSTQSNIMLTANIDGEQEMTLNILNTGSATQGSLDTTYDFSITNEGETTGINYTSTLEFINELEDKVTLDETNCAILNDYSQEELASLMNAIANQTVTVFTQKATMIGIIETELTQPQTTVTE